MRRGLIVYVLVPFLLVFGLFGSFGILVGEIGWFLVGSMAVLLGIGLLNSEVNRYHREHYPEHAIVSEWDDERADTVYSYEHYGRRVSEGGRLWARDIAEHYGIEMPEERPR